MAALYTLGKSERLKSRKRIGRLFEAGSRLHAGPVRAHYRFHREGMGGLQAGFGVSVRQFRRATDRNRVKRLLREAWRLQQPPLRERFAGSGLSMDVFLTYTGREMPGFPEVHAWVGGIIRRLSNIPGDGSAQ